MKRNIFCVLSLFLSLTLNAQLPLSVQQRLQDTLNYLRSHDDYVGLSACASVKGKGLWKGTAGVSEPGVPLTTDMLIGIASNTKPFVSAMMLKLEEDGLVSIHDTIGTWIQGYDNIDGAITIAQILSHLSGISDILQYPTFEDSISQNFSRIWTKEELLHDFVGAPYFAAGAGWHYSNTNYIIAGIIEEQITGRPIDELLRDSIFIPLHLNHTFYPPQQTPTYPRAQTWYNANNPPYNFPLEFYSVESSAGGIIANPEDVVHFWEGLFEGAIIKKTTLNTQMLHLFASNANGGGYGLGINKGFYTIDGVQHPVYSHGGTWMGELNENLVDTANGITIDVLTNESSLGNEKLREVVAAIYKILLDETTSIAEVPERALLNCYPNPAHDILHIPNKEGNLKTIQLFDLKGKMLFKHFVTPGVTPILLNVRKFEPGTYVLKVQTNSNIEENEKIMISR